MQTDGGLNHQAQGGPVPVLTLSSLGHSAKDSILPQTSGEVVLYRANLSLLFDFLFCIFGEIRLL